MSESDFKMPMRVAKSVAAKFWKRAALLGLTEDVPGEANLAVVRAIKSYKPSDRITLSKHVLAMSKPI